MEHMSSFMQSFMMCFNAVIKVQAFNLFLYVGLYGIMSVLLILDDSLLDPSLKH